MQVLRIVDIEDPRVQAYRNVREADLKGRERLFIAEGRLVVSLLLRGCRFPVDSVLVTEAALEAIRPDLDASESPPPVLVASPEVMNSIVGFDIHRGCLAAGKRTPVSDASELLTAEPDARLIVAVEDLFNHDNLGGVFRSAAAFGVGAILLSPRCCDPLYRKAIRVSMGHALRVPYGTIPAAAEGASVLKRLGVYTIALTPQDSSASLRDCADRIRSERPDRVCLLLGSEGPGLSDAMIRGADLRVSIPIARGVDSLNASVAGAIAMQRIAEAMGLL
jgi:tRNA G18 (ribose-2'-O)-methylase SpoU